MDMPPMDEEVDEGELDKKLLAELTQWAAQGNAGDMRERLGKTPPPGPGLEGMDEEMPPGDEVPMEGEAPEAAAIPGVEGEEMEEGAAGPDMEKLKAVLASLRGG